MIRRLFSLFNIAFYHFPFLIHKAIFPGGVLTYWENRSRRLNNQRDAAFFLLITQGIILKSEQRTYTSQLLLEPRLGMQITRKSKRVERQVKKETKDGEEAAILEAMAIQAMYSPSGGSPNLKCPFCLKIDPININSMVPSLKSY